MGHCQALRPLCPLQAETAVVDSQQGLPSGSIGMATTEQEPVVDGFPASPPFIQIPHPRHQGPSTNEAILLGHPEQSMFLTRCGLPRSPVDLTDINGLVAAWLCMMWLMVASLQESDPCDQQYTLPHNPISCPIPIGVEWGIIRTINKNWEKNMRLSIFSCHSANADLGKWPPKLWFWTLTIPLGIGVKAWPR